MKKIMLSIYAGTFLSIAILGGVMIGLYPDEFTIVGLAGIFLLLVSPCFAVYLILSNEPGKE
jgi:hypothetical protein